MIRQIDYIRGVLIIFQMIFDVIIFFGSFYIASSIFFPGTGIKIFPIGMLIFFAGSIILAFYYNSLYGFRSWLFWDEIRAVFRSVILIFLIAVLYLYTQRLNSSRFNLMWGFVIFAPLCLIVRYIFRRVLFYFGILVTNVIIFGAGRTGEIFSQVVDEHPFTMCKVIGFLDDDKNKIGTKINNIKVLGNLRKYNTIRKKYKIDEVAIAISTASRDLISEILDMVEFHVRQVHYIPDMYMITTFSEQVRDVDGVPVILASRGLLDPFNKFIKNIIDYAGAVIALIIFSPFMFWLAYKIHKKDCGRALITQERIGYNEKIFNMYKFRIMRVGKYERNLNINELPGLFNVLRGEMSLVGPRALLKGDYKYLYDNSEDKKIFGIKPGLTGMWQISGRKYTDRLSRLETDLYYIRNWSIWLDFVILLRTFREIILPKKRREIKN